MLPNSATTHLVKHVVPGKNVENVRSRLYVPPGVVRQMKAGADGYACRLSQNETPVSPNVAGIRSPVEGYLCWFKCLYVCVHVKDGRLEYCLVKGGPTRHADLGTLCSIRFSRGHRRLIPLRQEG